MKETVEFRIPEDRVEVLFGADEGQSLGGTVRKSALEAKDPRYLEVGRANDAFLIHSEGKRSFFYGWSVTRHYSTAELKNAELFKCNVSRAFEPTGEECGTVYDESTACPKCGSGAKQTTPLYLRLSSIPKSVDIARTIAGKIVVSKRLVDLFSAESISGVEFHPVATKRLTGHSLPQWYQLIGTRNDVDIAPPTRAGANPFDQEERHRCPLGDLIGMHLLTEVFVDAGTRGVEDVVFTRQYVGLRTGLLRPERIMLVSPRTRELVIRQKLKGFEFEVAYLV